MVISDIDYCSLICMPFYSIQVGSSPPCSKVRIDDRLCSIDARSITLYYDITSMAPLLYCNRWYYSVISESMYSDLLIRWYAFYSKARVHY